MVRFLILLKRKFPFFWTLIEFFNGFAFDIFFGARVRDVLADKAKILSDRGFVYRLLDSGDIDSLVIFLSRQDQDQFSYFKPHDFDRPSLVRLLKNPSFVMLGVFDEGALIGYFFLRCFVNKKCFTGRLVDSAYQGRGIAKNMGRILLESAWAVGFRVFGTASKRNVSSLSSYRAINDFKIIKELDGGYIFFEYVKPNV